MIRLPFETGSSFTHELSLDGNSYIFEYNYNSLGKYWTLDIYDTDNNVLINGVKLLNMTEVLIMWVDRGLPENPLLVLNALGEYSSIDFSDFVNGKELLIFGGV